MSVSTVPLSVLVVGVSDGTVVGSVIGGRREREREKGGGLFKKTEFRDVKGDKICMIIAMQASCIYTCTILVLSAMGAINITWDG